MAPDSPLSSALGAVGSTVTNVVSTVTGAGAAATAPVICRTWPGSRPPRRDRPAARRCVIRGHAAGGRGPFRTLIRYPLLSLPAVIVWL